RKRGKHLANVIVHRSAAGAKFLSWPQFHFHFANYQTHRSSTNVSRAPGSSTRVFDTRILRDELRASVRPATASQERLAYRSTRSINGALQPAAKQRQFEHPFLSAPKSRAAHSFASHVAAPRKYLFSRPVVSSLRPFRPKDAAPQGRQLRIVHYWSPLLLAPSRTKSDSASPRAAERKVLVPQSHRTEELVWRRISKSTTEITERVRHLESIVSSDGPSPRAVSNEQTAVEVARAIEAVRATPVTKLDPALMDRLANDVIRRVEQRVRIERERRGL
ncbi:MAG TPA: hypothetical protein VGW58_16455, partial [Pyrinomonadaceae bacterium]|nr:hypothetical protein [Pyrinomonadaceae bacterium]